MYYVTTIDRFMSGWGHAEGKTNVLIFECETRKEALVVFQNAKDRGDQSEIKLHQALPKFYPKSRFHIQRKTKSIYPRWYTTDRPWGSKSV